MIKLLKALCLSSLIAGLSVSAYAEEKPKPDFEAQFKKLDKNNDGKLSLEEFTAKKDADKAKKAFKRLDKDSDGFLSLEEFKARNMKAK